MKVGVVIVVASLLTALGGWATWAALASSAAGQVEAGWTVDCSHTKIGSYQGQPAVHSRPGWKCDIELTITNSGSRSVEVRSVEAALLGPGGGAEIRALPTDGAELAPAGPNGLDAMWNVDLTVPGGESRVITLEVGWRREGCNSGGHLSLENWPVVEFEALGRTYRHSPDQQFILRTFDDPHDDAACPDL